MEEGQLEEYQKQVERMQRLMEETRLVSECRIRALTEENEALKVHLKLAVESLKTPIVLPKRFSGMSRRDSMLSEQDARDMRAQVEDAEDAEAILEEGSDDGYISAGSYEQDDEDLEEVQEVQLQMQELLNDLGLFRRKLGDDRGRFLGSGHRRDGSEVESEV